MCIHPEKRNGPELICGIFNAESKFSHKLEEYCVSYYGQTYYPNKNIPVTSDFK